MINGSSGSDLPQMRCNYLLNMTQLQKTKVYATLKAEALWCEQVDGRAMTLCVRI